MGELQYENDARHFIMNTLDMKELPSGSLQEILQDGMLLCDLIMRFDPPEKIVIKKSKTIFSKQDYIAQFLIAAESLGIPQSQLFSTVDLLEGKRMQSVVNCLLNIRRKLTEKSSSPKVQRKYPKTYSSPSFQKDHVKTAATIFGESKLLSPEITPKPSKSTPLKSIKAMEQASRKVSLKRMESDTIKVKNDYGTMDTYAIGNRIGKGQFGEVFGGLNMCTEEYVAIKRIQKNEVGCDDMNEIGVLKHLNSEHIVRYKGFADDKKYLYIILEYVEMGSLLSIIKAFGKFTEKLAASYTFKILSGLEYLHSENVVHCDLKAANILTTKTGSLKLADFGVSSSLKFQKNDYEPAGTPNWMAPEVIKFDGASDKSDIWSLGCTIVEMLTGKPPYADLSSFSTLYRVVEDKEPPMPKKIKLSEEATEFLLACFQKNPKKRPSAQELMRFRWMAPYFSKKQNEIKSNYRIPRKSVFSEPILQDITSERNSVYSARTQIKVSRCQDCLKYQRECSCLASTVYLHPKFATSHSEKFEKSYAPLRRLSDTPITHSEGKKTSYISEQFQITKHIIPNLI